MSSTKPKTPWLNEVADRFTASVSARKRCVCKEPKAKYQMVVVGHTSRMSLNICQRCKGVVR